MFTGTVALLWAAASSAPLTLDGAVDRCGGELGVRWVCMLPDAAESDAAREACAKACAPDDSGERCRIACDRAALRENDECEYARSRQLKRDLNRCRAELLGIGGADGESVPELLMRSGPWGWYPVPVDPVKHEEHPTICESDWGKDAVAEVAQAKGGPVYRCTLQPDDETVRPLREQAADLADEQLDKPEGKRLDEAAVRRKVAQGAGALCPKGMKLEWEEEAPLCARAYAAKAFCPKGTPADSQFDAGCGWTGCAAGLVDLGRLKGAKLAGCARCSLGGEVDAAETARWAQERGSEAEVLCKLRLAAVESSGRRRVAEVYAKRARLAAEADATLRKALAERGVAPDRLLPLQRRGDRWPPVFRLAWRADDATAADADAAVIAAALADKLPAAALVRLVATDLSGRPVFVADWFSVEPGRLFNRHRTPSETDW